MQEAAAVAAAAASAASSAADGSPSTSVRVRPAAAAGNSWAGWQAGSKQPGRSWSLGELARSVGLESRRRRTDGRTDR